MKPLLGLFVTAIFSLGITACGNSGGPISRGTSAVATVATTASDATTTNYTRTDADKDNDLGSPYDDTNNDVALNYGHAADTSDRLAATEIVKRYYAAAAAEDGAAGCSLVALSLSEAVVEDYGQGSGGAPYLKTGTSCSQVLTLLFKHYHGKLVAEQAKLAVRRVRLIGHQGFVIMSFGTLPERRIGVGREGHSWKIQNLLDSELP